MPNTGVNAVFAKCFIFFMAFVILLQGGVYLSLSIWGITLRQCSKDVLDLSSQPFQFAMNLIYFLNSDCGNPSVKVPDLTKPVTLDVDFNKAEPIEQRLFILLISYAVISTVWIVTSLTIIASLCGPITRKVNGLCFWPWFLVIMAGCILDAAATGFHIHDIINTTSVQKTFEYLSITTNERTVEILSNYDAYFVTPAAIMVCITSRVILIWLLNIFGSFFCLSLSKTLSKKDNGTTTTYITNIQQESCQEILPAQRRLQKEGPNIRERSKPPSLKLQSAQRPTKHSDQSPITYDIQSPTAKNVYQTDPSRNEQQSNIINCNTETYPEGINCPSQCNVSQYQQQLSPISPLNHRYSTHNESFQFPTHNQRVSKELRGQLPWSYTSMPAPVTKKPQSQAVEKRNSINSYLFHV